MDIPRIIGHRGARANAPENTLAGIRAAHDEGARWVEFDVKLTEDGVPVLIHDETLDRTTNGRGPVRAISAAAIAKLDAGGWFDRRFAGERVPTLAAALELLARYGMGFNLEIKPCPGREAETARIALDIVKQQWPTRLPVPVVSCFKTEGLRVARVVAPDYPRGYLVERLPADWQAQAMASECRTVHPGMRDLTRAQVQAVKAAGFPILAWTVNEPGRARELLEWGVDSLITDKPAAIAAAILAS
jgi:glycerophosphoryl diester phosphodiesterase